MVKISLPALALLAALALAGCGGGGDGGDDAVIDPRTKQEVQFIDWSSNASSSNASSGTSTSSSNASSSNSASSSSSTSGDIVKDEGMSEFKFTTSTPEAPSCLYDVDSKSVILTFCQAPDQQSTRYKFVNRYIDVRMATLPDGSCGPALVDVELGSIVHIYVQDEAVTVLADPTPATAC